MSTKSTISVGILLRFGQKSDLLRAYCGNGHARSLCAAKCLDVTSQSFTDKIRASAVLNLSDEIDLFQQARRKGHKYFLRHLRSSKNEIFTKTDKPIDVRKTFRLC